MDDEGESPVVIIDFQNYLYRQQTTIFVDHELVKFYSGKGRFAGNWEVWQRTGKGSYSESICNFCSYELF